ncbi:MAG: T9SS type A sorting domain-containing protein [Bacteroidales bacterium]|nr:T9SS type A sorting domain-containing protein [Bacteroidales bacterium]
MKTVTQFSLIFCLFLLYPFVAKSLPLPTDMRVAQSAGSGSWNDPATWTWLVNPDGLSIPNDSTFVIINSGHTVTLATNAKCLGLQIKPNSTLDDGDNELLIRFMHWAHGINWPEDDGGTDPAYVWATIDSTWDITNPENGNWNIYMVDGTHAGSGNIIFSFIDDEDNWTNSFGGTVTGSGNITNTGSTYYRDMGSAQNGLKFNSACNLSFYCDLDLTDVDYPENGGAALSHKNYGTISLKGNADMVAGASFGTFSNTPDAGIIIENGSLYMGLLTSTVFFFVNEGLIQLQNGDFHIPSQSYMSNQDSIIVNGDILGVDAVDGSSSIVQEKVGCVIAVTGEIFPEGNIGCLDCSSPYAYEPNFVIYNGSGSQNLAVPRMAMEPTSYIPYSNLIINNSGAGVSMIDNISIDGTLTLTNGLLNLGSYDLTLNENSDIEGTPTANNMVVATGTGELKKVFTSVGSFTFPIGDNTGTAEYSPVTLNLNAGNFEGAYAGANLANEPYPGVTGNFLNRYWNLTSSGITDLLCDVTFNYVPADVNGIEDSIYCYLVSPTTERYDISDVSLHQLTASGISNLGTFTGRSQGLPFAFEVTGTGSYCAGSDGLPVGLSGSETGVVYTLYKNDIAEASMTGTGSEISFGNQLAATYTISGTNDNGTTPMTGIAVLTENQIPEVSWPSFEPSVICIEDWGPVTLTGGLPEGGTYSGDGVSNNIFDQSVAGEGVHQITYTYTDANNCSNTATYELTVFTCVGVKEQTSEIVIYPNPATDNIIVKLNNNQTITRISLINALGLKMYDNQDVNSSGTAMIAVQNLPAGNYILRIISNNDTFMKAVIIK